MTFIDPYWRNDPDAPFEMRVLKEQLRQGLIDPSQIPEGALWRAAPVP